MRTLPSAIFGSNAQMATVTVRQKAGYQDPIGCDTDSKLRLTLLGLIIRQRLRRSATAAGDRRPHIKSAHDTDIYDLSLFFQ